MNVNTGLFLRLWMSSQNDMILIRWNLCLSDRLMLAKCCGKVCSWIKWAHFCQVSLPRSFLSKTKSLCWIQFLVYLLKSVSVLQRYQTSPSWAVSFNFCVRNLNWHPYKIAKWFLLCHVANANPQKTLKTPYILTLTESTSVTREIAWILVRLVHAK